VRPSTSTATPPTSGQFQSSSGRGHGTALQGVAIESYDMLADEVPDDKKARISCFSGMRHLFLPFKERSKRRKKIDVQCR
jgi:hypothetical protein